MQKKKEKLNFKEFLKTLKWIFKIYLEISPSKTISMLLTRVLMDLRSLVYSAILAKVVDRLVFIASTESKDFSLIIPYVVILVLYYIFAESILTSIYTYSSRGLVHITRGKLDLLFAKQLNYIGIQSLENPDTVNMVQRSGEWLYNTFQTLNDTVAFLSNIVRMIVSGIVILSFLPYMIPVLVVITVVRFVPTNHFIKKNFRWHVDNTEGKRIAGKSIGWITNPVALQEISIVGGYKFFSEKFDSYNEWFNKNLLKIMKQKEIVILLLDLVDIVVSVFGYVMIFNSFILGKITLGAVTFQMRALDSFSGALDSVLGSVSFMNEFAIKMKDLITVFEMKPSVKDGHVKLEYLDTPPSIEFRNVYFKYPKSKKYVFEDLSFKIDSGEEVALVGHNGAGKTTIVKLISRIYEVEKGEILINGQNIKDLSLDDWYKNIGVLFQDFNFYGNLTVKENIFLGRPLEPLDEDRIVEAAKHADAHDFIMEYKKKYDQIMSEKFKGGIRPSTGQAQKIAIARFFYRNSPLVIFDEPTASIDAVSEYKIFNSIYDFFKNKTVIIISHRFSTVRNANRIIVLEKGKIVEEGTHKELVKKKNGVYSKAYKLQAEGYKE